MVPIVGFELTTYRVRAGVWGFPAQPVAAVARPDECFYVRNLVH